MAVEPGTVSLTVLDSEVKLGVLESEGELGAVSLVVLESEVEIEVAVLEPEVKLVEVSLVEIGVAVLGLEMEIGQAEIGLEMDFEPELETNQFQNTQNMPVSIQYGLGQEHELSGACEDCGFHPPRNYDIRSR